MNINVGNKLKQLRKSKSMSQEQVADYLHLSQSAYARMESGESHSWASHIDKLCEVFEITPEELVRGEKMIVGNIGTNNGVGYAEVVNQLSEKLIEQYEERIKDLKQTILDLKNK
ncbi:transcriptional regulator with XRE-family HTH domain [Flavobacterium sp. CG_9.1]|uniref:helix-turn-helix domain-containing protein n=1 Tax=Flavobacterium sp. CG_9.1 TaxID=2787728 RepID=UPI0018C9813A|nr:helix-turn-helix transcriptional regulator [Flavobacterium sp. CG_9.1]MBG6061000.1 transcriptional regulator with XRE-family HTH domain [Flavobacterium sp. CG_9.1]